MRPQCSTGVGISTIRIVAAALIDEEPESFGYEPRFGYSYAEILAAPAGNAREIVTIKRVVCCRRSRTVPSALETGGKVAQRRAVAKPSWLA